MRWGLIPHWSKGPTNQFSMFNARSETAAVKSSFREPLKNQHCLIPADGYYEWVAEKNGKKAYRITTEHRLTFAFAGIWDLWQTSDAKIFSFAILTTHSCPKLSAIHHRMPIIIQRKYYSDWLTNSRTQKCLSGNSSATLIVSQVSNRINNPRNDGPDVWLP
jgi:putative SOS response-associated peptidase YedK